MKKENKLTFEERLGNAIEEAIARTNEIEESKEPNMILLKEEMLKRIEEALIKSVPNRMVETDCTIIGPLFFVMEENGKFYIDMSRVVSCKNVMVFFNDIEEIKVFLEEIKNDFPGKGIKYTLNVYADSNIHKASVLFEYEYKKS